MPESPPTHHSAVIKVAYGLRVDARWERKWLSHNAVFAFGDEVRLPLQTLDLPRAQEEGCDGDNGEDDEAWSMPAPGAHQSGGVVEDRGKVWVIGWLARLVCAVGGL